MQTQCKYMVDVVYPFALLGPRVVRVGREYCVSTVLVSVSTEGVGCGMPDAWELFVCICQWQGPSLASRDVFPESAFLRQVFPRLFFFTK
jgi:hypothetical protein